jgi:hypothetical protein
VAFDCNVETVPEEATSVFLDVVSQDNVEPDWLEYMVHKVFSNQLSFLDVTHELSLLSVLSVQSPTDGEDACVVFFNT